MSNFTWDDYNHDCDQCWVRYQNIPRADPCFQHKGNLQNTAPAAAKPLDEVGVGLVSGWEQMTPYPLETDPFLMNRLRFVKWRAERDNTL